MAGIRSRFIHRPAVFAFLAAVAALTGSVVAREGTALTPEDPLALRSVQRQPSSTAPRLRSLYDFWGSPSDGQYPLGDLVALHGILYGVTATGGNAGNHGTIYYVTPNGVERILHSFKDQLDGGYPWGGLVDVNGTLFGTTSLGGTNNRGVVYKLVDARREQVVYNFGDVPGDDANEPDAPMVYVNGSLYGTTDYSASGSCGTIFKVAPNGKSMSMVHEFDGFDGCNPTGLLYVNGTFYGTTTSESNSPAPYGTLYSFTPSGGFETLFSFGPEPGAGSPGGILVSLDGDLYGASAGGVSNYGTIYRFSPSTGTEKVIYTFTGQNDGGIYPGGLVVHDGVIFGWTGGGGKPYYQGRLFRITTSGSLTFLRAFDGADGSGPSGRMTFLNGVLYGTTTEGGVGRGNVFSFKL